jgi:uncharacterized protein YdaU (DUF1376 family)
MYPGDFLRDTSRMSTEAAGAYALMLFDYWQHGPLPDDKCVLMRVTRLPEDRFSQAWPFLSPLFVSTAGKLHHAELDLALEKARARRQRAYLNGQKGGRPAASKKPTRKAK